jgi:arylsulfatase A-like enzyme
LKRFIFATLLLGVAWSARAFAFALLLLASAFVGSESTAAETKRPNIVVFLADDLSTLDVAPYGERVIRTPNISRLAAAGMTFDRAYVASPSCAPSRAALLTGLMPARNGAEANHSAPRAEIKKWPAYFRELGYEVVAFGKVGHYKQTADYGFDRSEHMGFHDPQAIPTAVEYLTAHDAASAKPLCLMVGTHWPHVPWPEKNLGYAPSSLALPAGSIDTPATREWRARYAAAVTLCDDELGAVREAALRTLGDEALFVFTSDHGAQWPLGKWNCYEAGVNVPLVIAWPGRVQAGARSEAMVSWIDLLPTLVEAAGGAAPADIDGQSFLNVLEGRRDRHRDRIFTTHSNDRTWNIYPMRAVREGDWKLIVNLHPEFAFTTHIDLPGNLGQRAYFATWEAAAKTDPEAAELLRRYHQRPVVELYDLSVDPTERNNLADDPAQAERVRAMRQTLDEWMREQGDKQTVFVTPRLLSDPKSYGPDAPPGN